MDKPPRPRQHKRDMSPALLEWIADNGLTHEQAAQILGLPKRTMDQYAYGSVECRFGKLLAFRLQFPAHDEYGEELT